MTPRVNAPQHQPTAGAEAMIEHLQLAIAKLRREKFGPCSERSQRILDQLELQLEELAAARGEDAAKALPQSVEVQSCVRRKATRRAISGGLPRRQVVHADVVTEHVREKRNDQPAN